MVSICLQLLTDQMMLKQYAAQVEKLRDQIKSVEGGNILRERDLAARRADEAERKGKQVSHFLQCLVDPI